VSTGRRRRSPSLSVQIFIALGLGIAAGLFFGELIQPVQLLGNIFIGLLQMTVLPYILVALIGGLGRLSYVETRLLALKGGSFVLLFWAIGLAVIVLFTLSFPNWQSATFFSTSLVEPTSPVDLVSLYIPSNPFASLSDSVVPAIVLFSLAVGLAVIGVPGKGTFLANLDVLTNALMGIAQFVARLAPIGVFALVGSAAGTLDVQDLGRLQVYIVTYIAAALLLSLWVLPGLVAVLTPIPYRRVLASTQDALITAFATGSLLIVLPLLSERLKELLQEANLTGEGTDSAVDLVVPINFNLPNLGKLMSLAFVPFAGWFAGATVSADEMPMFLISGLVSFFGEVIVALPFLLDLMRIPADMFQLFVAVDVFTGRFGTLLAGVHTVVLALLTAAAVSGRTRLRWPVLARFTVASLVLTLGLFLGLRLFYQYLVPHEYRAYQNLVDMQLAGEPVPVESMKLEDVSPTPSRPGAGRIDLIKQRGALRVGYRRDLLPFVFRNARGQMVGFDVEMAHQLARDLEVDLELVRVKGDDQADYLEDGRVDIMMTGLTVTPDVAAEVRLSESYMDVTLAFVVRDHNRSKFNSREKVKALESPRIAIMNIPYYIEAVRRYLPEAELEVLDSPREFFQADEGEFDALFYTAEAGSGWTLVYPSFSVAIPRPDVVSVPLAYAMPRGADDLGDYVDTWITLKRQGGAIDRAYRHWILGKGAERTQPRWSVVRDVLGWVD
jgi:Na+/H+-dicarboxylate symporter/ABC-type amino acid transport substrate-binding protein